MAAEPEFDIFMISDDIYFVKALDYQFAALGLNYRSFVNLKIAREMLKVEKPRLLIVEWNLRDLEAIDFLIKVSEDLSWGDMTVYFVCNHAMSENERFHMMTLGTERSFLKDNLLENPHQLTDFLDEIQAILG